MRTEKLFASTGVRLSFVYSGLLVAAFSLAITLTWIVARSAAESDLRDRIELESAALKAEILDEGLAAAVAAIVSRAERPGALEYWLVDPAGKVLAGDLPAMATPDGWHRIEIPDSADGAENRDELLVLTAALPDGTRLSVGDDLRRAESVRDAVLRSLLWIGAVTVVLGIFVGTFVTRRSLTQMDALTSTLSEVADGRLDARIRPRNGITPNDLDRLGDSVNRMLDQIDSLVRNLRRVSSDLAHDLRTPLSHLQQRLERARTAGTANERQAAIEAAEDKITEVLQAFDAILRLAEIEAGAARSRFVEVNIAALVDRLADAYGPDVEASGRTLHVERRDHGSVRGDSDLLAQALANLVENAMHHTPAGTQISVSAAVEDSSLLLTVADNGSGIPAERRDEVLLPYSRLDKSRSTAGFGLGLSIVAAIARLHDAQLRLDDNCPGLRITIVFPLHPG